ncbi:MAG: DUF2764 family protein [Chlamydiia bacterium]
MYTFLECFLPPSSFDIKPEVNLRELDELYAQNLNFEDMKSLQMIHVFINILNLRAYFTADRLFLGGTIESDEIAYCLERELTYPPFVFDYLDKYPDINDRIHNFRELISTTYDWLIENSKGFVHDFFEYDRKLWITTMAYLGKKRGRKVEEDLGFLDPKDDVVKMLLEQRDSEHFEFPEGLEGIDLELDIAFSDPLKEIDMIARLRFNFCQNCLQSSPFTLDSILAYYMQILVLTDFNESHDEGLTKKGGDLLLKRIQEIK